MCNYKYNIDTNTFEESADLSIPELNIIITTPAIAIARLAEHKAKLAIQIDTTKPFKAISLSLNELWSYATYKKLVMLHDYCTLVIDKLKEIQSGELVAMTESIDDEFKIFVMDEYQQAMYYQLTA